MMEEFMKQAGELSMRILNALALAMDIKVTVFTMRMIALRRKSFVSSGLTPEWVVVKI